LPGLQLRLAKFFPDAAQRDGGSVSAQEVAQPKRDHEPS
jgi:hypothetical protein